MVEPAFEYIVLQGQFVPTKYHSVSFVDTKYIYNTRIIKDGAEVTPIFIENVKTISNQNETINQLVQSIFHWA